MLNQLFQYEGIIGCIVSTNEYSWPVVSELNWTSFNPGFSRWKNPNVFHFSKEL